MSKGYKIHNYSALINDPFWDKSTSDCISTKSVLMKHSA